MNEETRKYFDEKFGSLATLDELNDVRSQLEGDLELMENRIIARIDRSQEELAGMIARSFDTHEKKLSRLELVRNNVESQNQ